MMFTLLLEIIGVWRNTVRLLKCLTIFLIVGMMNAFNYIDGLNGLWLISMLDLND